MSDIYELFNRKKEISVLEERFEVEDPFDIMEDIIQESNIQLIQIQADSYVNELLIEEAIYDDFDEGYIHGLMESSFSEKKDKLIKFIQDKWAKIKAWFKRVVENVKNFFRRNKASLKTKEGKPVDRQLAMEALKKCEKEVMVMVALLQAETLGRVYSRAYRKFDNMIDELFVIYDNCLDDKISLSDSKDKALSIIGVKDKKEINKVMLEMFGVNKVTKAKIKDVDHEAVLDYAFEEKEIIDVLYKDIDIINKEHQELITELKSSKEDERIDEKVTLLNYITNLQGSMISGLINVTKKMASEGRKVLNIALGVKANSDGDENNNDN